MSTERMSDKHLAVYEAEAQECDGLTPSACREVLAEARRARAEVARLREELESVAANRAELVGVVTETVAERDAEHDANVRLCAKLDAERARAEMAEQTRDGLREENGRLRTALNGLKRGDQSRGPCWCNFNSAIHRDHEPDCQRAAEVLK